METNPFIEKLEKRLRLPLPGHKAHDEMRAGASRSRFAEKERQTGAVLIACWQEGNKMVFPLIKRTEYEGVHSGQISLPGGKAEPQETAADTALREAEEEIGLSRSEVRVIGNLSPIEIIASHFIVTPVIGFAEKSPSLKPNAKEVQRILTVKLERLLDPAAAAITEILVSGHKVAAPHFAFEGEIVWGATAMILNELKHILQDKN